MIRIILIFVPVILVGLAVVTIFLTAVFKSGSVGRWIFIILLLPVILLIFYRLFIFRSRQIIVGEQVPAPAAKVFDHSPAADPVLWQEALEEEFVPDSYSSPKAAAYGLGAFAVPEAIAGLFEGQIPAEILIAEAGADSLLLGEMQRGLKKAYEGREIYIRGTAPDSVPEGQVWISLAVQEEPGRKLMIPERREADVIHMARQMDAGNRKGTLMAVIATSKGKTMKAISFDYRPWVTDFENFKTSLAWSGKNWLKIVSQDTAVSADEARGQVLQKVLQQVSGMIQIPAAAAAANPLAEKDLLKHGMIVDEYMQRLAGLAGPIWRHAILLDVSPERLAALSTEKKNIDRQVRMTWAKTLGSLAAMIVLVCLVYAVANAATKGYYSAVLAVTAVLAAVILGFLILLMTRAGVCL